MRSFFLGLSLFLGLSMTVGLTAAVVSAEPVVYQPGAFARDAASLRALDSRQLRIVRRATAQCWHSGEANFGSFRASGARGRACIIGQTERAIASSDDAALRAFHQALPFNARYNENRPAFYWQRLVAAK